MADETNSDITALTVQLLSAFVSNNTVSSDSLAELIKTTRAALTEDLMDPATVTEAAEFVPAVSVRKSLSSRDFIISLIDGKPYKTLKRHLTQHGLTPEQYRERYKLSKTYPLVAPNYSDARRAVAKKLGLGRKSSAAPIEKASPAPAAANAQPSVKAQKTSAVPAAKGRKRLSIAASKDETTAAPTPPNTETSAAATKPETAKVAKTSPTTKQKKLPKTKAAPASKGPASRSSASNSTSE